MQPKGRPEGGLKYPAQLSGPNHVAAALLGRILTCDFVWQPDGGVVQQVKAAGKGLMTQLSEP